MLKLFLFVISIFLITIISFRVPQESVGLGSFATKSNLLGSPNSAEKILNQFTWLLIAGYFILGVSFNVLN